MQSPHGLRCVFPIGLPVPLYAGAGPRAILAHLPEDVQQRIIARTEFIQLTESTAANPEDLEQRLAQVRTTGVAVDLGERVAGIATMAAPVLDVTTPDVMIRFTSSSTKPSRFVSGCGVNGVGLAAGAPRPQRTLLITGHPGLG
ncbi:MAG: IclR family transcriptional regulator C-terminal domain-containing protein, partial [Chloroflexota bacterium]